MTTGRMKLKMCSVKYRLTDNYFFDYKYIGYAGLMFSF